VVRLAWPWRHTRTLRSAEDGFTFTLLEQLHTEAAEPVDVGGRERIAGNRSNWGHVVEDLSRTDDLARFHAARATLEVAGQEGYLRVGARADQGVDFRLSITGESVAITNAGPAERTIVDYRIQQLGQYMHCEDASDHLQLTPSSLMLTKRSGPRPVMCHGSSLREVILPSEGRTPTLVELSRMPSMEMDVTALSPSHFCNTMALKLQRPTA
jgi:hypothetical protein